MSQKVQRYCNTNEQSKSFGKYFVRPVYDEKFITTDELADFIQTQCTVKRSDCKAVLDELGSAFKHYFELGQKIKLDSIGIFKVGLSSACSDTLSERDANGCLQIGTLNLTINKTPVIDIEGNWMLHPGESTTLKAVPTAGSDPIRNNGYKWSWGDTIVRDSVVTINNVTSNLDILLEATSIKNCTDTNWITITANVGIDEVEGLQVNIYPNPASRYINIESAEPMTDVVIYNTVGQQVISRTVEGNHTQLDLGSLASGHYTLRINGADGNQTTRKFIVRK